MSEPVKALIIGVPVAADGRPAGVLRFGHVSGYPITAAACRRCGTTRYEHDLDGPEDAARWLADHLVATHGAGVVVLDLRTMARSKRVPWRRQAPEVVDLVRRAWDRPVGHPLIVRWRPDGRRRAA